MKTEIKLGDKVRDKISGFIGIAVSKTEFLNGCIQWGVMPKAGKDGKMPEEVGIDEQSLEKIKVKNKNIKKKETGGAINRGGYKLRGF